MHPGPPPFSSDSVLNVLSIVYLCPSESVISILEYSIPGEMSFVI